MVITHVIVVKVVPVLLRVASVNEVGHGKYLDTVNHSFVLDMEAGGAKCYLSQMVDCGT